MKIIILIILCLIVYFTFCRNRENFDVVSNIVYKTYEAPYQTKGDTKEYRIIGESTRGNIKPFVKPMYESDLSYVSSPHINCCLIEKKYDMVPNKHNIKEIPGFFRDDSVIMPISERFNYIDSGKFKYNFTKLSNEQCNPQLYDLNNNRQLNIEGDNGWNNELCSANIPDNIKDKKIGSFAEVAKPEKQGFSGIGSCRFANKECIDFVDKKYCDKYNMQWSEKTCYEPLKFVFQDKIKIRVPEFKDNGGLVNLFPQPGVKPAHI